MNEKVNLENKDKSTKTEYRILLKNTFYSYLNMYGIYIFSLATSFIIARSISQELWGYLILSISIISLISNILNFFPPSLSYTLAYYIPRFLVEKEYGKLKSFIKFAAYQRLLFTLCFFAGSLLIFFVASELFTLVLEDYVFLLIILSPVLIKNGITQLYTGINQGFNQFKTIFLLTFIRYGIYIGGLISCVLIFHSVSLELITIFYLLSEITPSILNTINVLIVYMKIPNKSEEKFSLYETLKMILKYGSYVSIVSTFTSEWSQLEYQFIKIAEDPTWVTGYSIASNYFSVAQFSLSSFSNPLVVSFSRLDYKKNYNQLKSMFNLVFYYTSFFFMFINGILYYFADFFLSFFYGPSYLVFSNILKLILIMSIFRILGPQFGAMLQGTNRVKLFANITILSLVLRIPIALIGLFFFGITGLIIGNGIAFLIILIIYIYLIYRIFEIRLNQIKIVLQYILFFVSIIITNTLDLIFFNTLNQILLTNLNLISIFKSLNIFSLIIFILVYLSLNYIFKVFSQEDMKAIMKILEGRKKVNKFILKSLSLTKRFLR